METKTTTGKEDYSNSLSCSKCYAKHLSKAVIELEEYYEDNKRYEELTRCVGDIACAEDHAAALGLPQEKDKLRQVRDMIWNGDKNARVVLKDLAIKSVMSATQKTASAKSSGPTFRIEKPEDLKKRLEEAKQLPKLEPKPATAKPEIKVPVEVLPNKSFTPPYFADKKMEPEDAEVVSRPVEKSDEP